MFVLYDDGLIIFKASELYELTEDFGAWDYSRNHNKFYHTYITQKEIEKLLGELKTHRLFYLKDDYSSYSEKTDQSWTILYFWNKKNIKRIFVEDYIHNNYLPQVIHIIQRKLNNLNWLTKKDIQIWEPTHSKIVFTPYRSASLKEVVMCSKEWNVHKYRSGM
ncbi:hypothetical protein [Candidatus Uabimicrobium sp. HlEnr_7]|uniref:hypothetical protein n=1 Tax=Candidatus Uabimicrobium helgolandensis TaxID=3095367 RepID=UPI003556C011